MIIRIVAARTTGTTYKDESPPNRFEVTGNISVDCPDGLCCRSDEAKILLVYTQDATKATTQNKNPWTWLYAADASGDEYA